MALLGDGHGPVHLSPARLGDGHREDGHLDGSCTGSRATYAAAAQRRSSTEIAASMFWVTA